MSSLDAVVVGSGPNGLTAAVLLAKAGLEVKVLESRETVGGGTRTEELTLPGFHHDVCSAFHPLGAASPAFAELPLADHGLQWIRPEIQVAHPLADGTAAALWHSLDRSVESLGADGPHWRRLAERVASHWDTVSETLMQPLARLPDRPFELLSLWRGALPATWAARGFRTDGGAALFAGIAAHSMLRLSAPITAATGMVLGGLAHVEGWPVARGGSATITRSLASLLTELGGTIETNRPVRRAADLPEAKVTVFNTLPSTLTDVYGSLLPASTRRWVRRWRVGAGAYKVDYALAGPIPWTADECRRAGTVHVGGSLLDIVAAESIVASGGLPDRPFVLVGQQSLVDSSRAPDGHHTAWAYTHVPNGFGGSMLQQVESQLERYAPGFRDLVIGRRVTGPSALEEHNSNYRGGDIGGGSTSIRQVFARPRLGPNPYRTGLPGVYLASASTPPGPGVHGMAGHHAAQLVLRDHFR